MIAQFPELARLLENDQDKVRRVVWEFYRSATKDLHRLEQAVAAHDWQVVRGMAYRLHVSCLQVGEGAAADAAARLASISSEFFAEAYERRRLPIVESLDRAEQFLGSGITSESSRVDGF